MSEEQKTSKGFLLDPEGDFSSGRLIKIISICVAAMLATASVILLSIGTIPLERVEFLGDMTGRFLLVAGASEIVQKATGK